MAKVITIIISGFLLILAIIFIKYKPVYEVTVAGEKVGYITNLNEFKDLIEKKIINQEGKNIVNVSLINIPAYEMKLFARENNSNEQEIIEKMKSSNTIITYK